MFSLCIIGVFKGRQVHLDKGNEGQLGLGGKVLQGRRRIYVDAIRKKGRACVRSAS